MKTETKKTNRLYIQTAGLFNSPHEWCIVDFVYWKSNTQPDRRWTCRMKPIQETTPVKRIETITDALDRMCERGMGFSKVPFGTPQRRRCGNGLTTEPKQSFQYVFDAKAFDVWAKNQSAKPIRKRIDPYPKPDSQLSESGQETYPKADTKRMNEEREKKEPKEAACLSQPPTLPLGVASFQGMSGDEAAKRFEEIWNASLPKP